MIRSRAFLCAAALVASACAHAPPPMHGARLQIEEGRGGLRPYVHATVAGRPVRFLVDTGSFRSLLPGKLARELGLSAGRESQALELVDANGRHRMMPFLGHVPVTFDGEASGGTIDFYRNDADTGTDGVLTPQELVHGDLALVIDLEHESLSLELESLALARLGASLHEEPFDRCLAEGIFHEKTHRIVSARVNGVPARMLVDTGAEVTALARNNRALSSLGASLGQAGTVKGLMSSGQGLVVDEVPIEFAKASFVLQPWVVPASSQCSEGALGADVLRHCTVVWGASRLWVGCRPPAAAR